MQQFFSKLIKHNIWLEMSFDEFHNLSLFTLRCGVKQFSFKSTPEMMCDNTFPFEDEIIKRIKINFNITL